MVVMQLAMAHTQVETAASAPASVLDRETHESLSSASLIDEAYPIYLLRYSSTTFSSDAYLLYREVPSTPRLKLTSAAV